MFNSWDFAHYFFLGLLILVVWCLIESILNRRRARRAGFERFSD